MKCRNAKRAAADRLFTDRTGKSRKARTCTALDKKLTIAANERRKVVEMFTDGQLRKSAAKQLEELICVRFYGGDSELCCRMDAVAAAGNEVENDPRITDAIQRAHHGYYEKVHKIALALKDCSNVRLHGDIKARRVTMAMLVEFSSLDFFPERVFPRLHERHMADLAKQQHRIDMAKVAETGAIKCRKCKRRGGVTWRQLQTRSGDEGMTAFFHCTHCDGRWRES